MRSIPSPRRAPFVALICLVPLAGCPQGELISRDLRGPLPADIDAAVAGGGGTILAGLDAGLAGGAGSAAGGGSLAGGSRARAGGGEISVPDAGPPPDLDLPYAQVGTTCRSGARTTHVVLSRTPVDCRRAAELVAAGSTTSGGTLAVALNGASGSVSGRACLDDGRCAAASGAVMTQGGAGASVVALDLSLSLLGDTFERSYDAPSCDFDGIVPLPSGRPEARGVSIRKLSLYQAIEVPLVVDGVTASRTLPILAGRDALVRAFVTRGASYDGRALLAELTVGERVFQDTVTLSSDGTDGTLGSTVNFDVPGSALSANAGISLALFETGSCNAPTGEVVRPRAPASGSVPLEAGSAGRLRVVVVPMAYQHDGSGRLPDTSDAHMTAFRELVEAAMPLSDVSLSVRAPVTYDGRVSANGDGWEAALDECLALREADGVDDDVYYYCFFSPAESAFAFCSRGCVAGLGPVAPLWAVGSRGSVGLGFPDSEDTFIHELGHSLGRSHSPCGGVSGADPSYPHSGGQIGVWGWDPRSRRLLSPTGNTDYMGYCDDQWTSDFTYSAVYQRFEGVNGAAFRRAPVASVARVLMDPGAGGAVRFGRTTRHAPPSGDEVELVEWLDGSGRVIDEAEVVYETLEDIGGAFYYVPWPLPDEVRGLRLPDGREVAW